VSSAAITLRVVSQRVFIVVYFIIDSVRKLFDTPSYKLPKSRTNGGISTEFCADIVFITPLKPPDAVSRQNIYGAIKSTLYDVLRYE
jgi:hypothetical protein